MSAEMPQRKEQPNTYFVQERHNEDEMQRLRIQDKLLTDGMGGVLPEQSDPTAFRSVIDVGCGIGSWLIETAKTYPDIKLLVGVDVSSHMLEYARARAEVEQVNNRTEFHVMDALRMIEFPEGFFDLVNQRLGYSYLRKWEWPGLLEEYQRITQIGGTIRITEADAFGESNSPALTQLYTLGREAFNNAGHLFTPGRTGVTSQLPDLLHQSGIQNVQTRTVLLEFPASTPEGRSFAGDIKLAFRTILPFLRKWTQVPDDYEQIYQQALKEMQQPDFVVNWEMVTAWGTNGGRRERPPFDSH